MINIITKVPLESLAKGFAARAVSLAFGRYVTILITLLLNLFVCTFLNEHLTLQIDFKKKETL